VTERPRKRAEYTPRRPEGSLSEGEGRKVVGRNKKARHEYEVLETLEAGLVLKGPEVKSIRAGKIGFQDAFARFEGDGVWLHNLHVSPYEPATCWNEDPLRPRKLLLNRQEIRRLRSKVEEKGLTLVPLDLYFRGGYAKVTLALARGRKLHDKREKLKREAQEREARRAIESHR
jgi:SsrA-binding protein